MRFAPLVCLGLVLSALSGAAEDAYSVTFSSNGGYGIMSNQTVACDAAVPLKENQFWHDEGYLFAGWGTNTYQAVFADGQSVSNLTVAGGTVALYAVWTGMPYRVEFVPCTAAFQDELDSLAVVPDEMPAQDFVFGKPAALNLNCYQLPSYVFQGWSTEAAPNTVAFTDGGVVGDLSATGGVVRLYANWKKDSLTTVYDIDPAKVGAYEFDSLSKNKRLQFLGSLTSAMHTNTFTVSYTASKTAQYRVSIDPLEGSRRDVQLEVAWFQDQTNRVAVTVTDFAHASQTVSFTKGQTYTFTVSVKDSVLKEGTSYAYNVGVNCEEAAVDYYLHSGVLTDEKDRERGTNFVFTVGTPYGYCPSVDAKDGKEFLGWFTNETGHVSVNEASLVRAGRLSARWDEGVYSYTVSFDANGGKSADESAMASLRVTSDESFALPSNIYTRVGYAFKGWSKSKQGAVAFADSAVIDEALASTADEKVVLYAVWSSDVPASEAEADANGIVWKFVEEKGGTARISNWDEGSEAALPVLSVDFAGAVVIPETITTEEGSNLVVTVIGENAFAGCSRITSVTIPKTVTTIQAAAFRDCVSLREVIFAGDHVITEIPEQCFAGCAALESIDLPYSLTTIGDDAFANCTALGPGITIPEHVTEMGAGVFRACSSLAIVRYLGDEPEDADDDVYADAPSGLKTGVLALRAGTDGTWTLPGTWKDGTNVEWKTKAYSLVRVRFDANGGTDSVTNWCVKGHALLELPEEPTPVTISEGNYEVEPTFIGWFTKKTGGVEVTEETVITGAQTFYAQWEADWENAAVKVVDGVDLLGFDGEFPLDTTAATVFNGFLRAVDGADLLGTIQAKIAKGVVKNGVTNSTVTAVVTRNGVKRTYTGVMKNGLDVEVLPKTAYETTSYVLHFDAFAMTGRDSTVEDDSDSTVEIVGSRNGMDRAGDYEFDMKAELEANYKGTWICSYEVDAEAGSDPLRLVLSVGAGGAVKVTGLAPDGTAISATAQLVMGVDMACIPLELFLANGATFRTVVQLTPVDDDATLDISSFYSSTYTLKNGTVFELEEVVGGSPAEAIAVSFTPETQLQMVGVAYAVQATLGDALAYPAKFSATKLPSGLKIDAQTGLVSGVPTKAGEQTATIKATSTVLSKVSGSDAFDFTIEELPDWAQGTFTGSLAQDETILPGTVTLTVSKIGKISGKILTPGTNWTFTATSYDATSAADELVIVATAKSGKQTRELTITVTETAVTGTFGTESSTIALTLVQQPNWKTLLGDDDALQITSFTGYYTATLTPLGDEGPGDGVGYLTLTVGKTGSLKYVGKLPDGTTLSGSTTLAYDGTDAFALIFSTPKSYQGGSVLLMPTIEGSETETDRTVSQLNAEDGLWSNYAPSATGEYAAGFSTTLELAGAWYSKTADLTEYYESSLIFTAETATLDASVKTTAWSETTGKRTTTTDWSEVEASEPDCWTALSVSLNERGTALVVDQKKSTPVKSEGEYVYEGENDAALTFAFTKATGIFKGSFLNWYDYDSEIDDTKETVKTTHTSKKVSFEGVAVQESGLATLAGFYLWKRTGLTEEGKTFNYTESHKVAFE